MSVVQLTSKSGLSPQMHKAVNSFSSDVDAAIDQAAEQGVPLELIIGSMVYAMFSALMQVDEEE